MYYLMGLNEFAKAMDNRVMRLMLKGVKHGRDTGRWRDINPDETLGEDDYNGRQMQQHIRMMTAELSDEE